MTPPPAPPGSTTPCPLPGGSCSTPDRLIGALDPASPNNVQTHCKLGPVQQLAARVSLKRCPPDAHGEANLNLGTSQSVAAPAELSAPVESRAFHDRPPAHGPTCRDSPDGKTAHVRKTFHAHPQAEILESMPGIGHPRRRAHRRRRRPERYADARHLASAAGLVPAPRDSGRRTGKLHRPMRYSRKLRRVFYLSAESAMMRQGPNRDFCLKKRGQGVKRWRDGTMALRWCAAGMVEASKQFRRVNGHLHLPALRTAHERRVAEHTVGADRHHETVNAAC